MTKTELLLLQTLLTKLKSDRPEYTVVLMDSADYAETVIAKAENDCIFAVQLDVQVQLCLVDEENPNLR